MEIPYIKQENDDIKEIKPKIEDSQEVSNTCATVTTDVAQFLESRSAVFTTNQPNNAALFKTNISYRPRKRRKKKKGLPNFAFNFPTSSTAPQASPSVSVGIKRPLSSIYSVVPNNEITKKPKFDERIQTINHDLTRAIISTNNRSLGPESLTLLRNAISERIDKIVDGTVPRFYESYIKFNAIVVRCVDVASLYWLSLQIGNISPWPEAKLKMIAFNELQRTFRASVWIPGSLVTTKTVLNRLNRQNPGLNTANWQIFAENLGASENGRTLFLVVPESDFKKLEASNFKAYLGLEQVNFVFSNINQEKLMAAIS